MAIYDSQIIQIPYQIYYLKMQKCILTVWTITFNTKFILRTTYSIKNLL